MSEVPRDPAIDSTLALLKEGYGFIWSRCRLFGSELFLTRIMGQQCVCIHGSEAAQLFYDERKFQRRDAIPRRVVTSLFGKHAIHSLDGAAHRYRKAAFLSLMTPESIRGLLEITAENWRVAIRTWAQAESVVLFDEAQQLLTRATCAWAGVPLSERDVARRARDFCLMVDAFGGAGPRLWRGKLARLRTEKWMTRIIEDHRRGKAGADERSPLHVMAELRGAGGQRLPAKTAAVELINVVRPTVAISWYIAFAALALHQHPDARRRLTHEVITPGPGEYTDIFTQEVRRFYPFAPFLGARVKAPFEWRGHHFEPGTLVLLDVYGANHDPALWDAPDEFRPERFAGRSNDAFTFIPQGGGDHATGHRCAGEWITMHQVALALHFLTRCMTYEVPEQDLSYDLTRMPTRPRSGLVMRAVHATAALTSAAPVFPSSAAAAAAEPHGHGPFVRRTA
jgi:fatty-acid peroxygenase